MCAWKCEHSPVAANKDRRVERKVSFFLKKNMENYAAHLTLNNITLLWKVLVCGVLNGESSYLWCFAFAWCGSLKSETFFPGGGSGREEANERRISFYHFGLMVMWYNNIDFNEVFPFVLCWLFTLLLSRNYGFHQGKWKMPEIPKFRPSLTFSWRWKLWK